MGFLSQWEKAKADYEKACKAARKLAPGDDAFEAAGQVTKAKSGLTPALKDLDFAFKEAEYILKKRIPATDVRVWGPTVKKIRVANTGFEAARKRLEDMMAKAQARGYANTPSKVPLTKASGALLDEVREIGDRIGKALQLMKDAGVPTRDRGTWT